MLKDLLSFSLKLALVLLVVLGVLYVHQNQLLLTDKSQSEIGETLSEPEDEPVSKKQEEQIADVLENAADGKPADEEQVSEIVDENQVPDEEGGEHKVLTATEINNAAKRCVYVIRATDGNVESSGTGFMCTDPEIMITNLHVLEGSDSVAIEDLEGNSVVFEGVLGWDQENDLAVIKVSGAKTKDFLKISESPVQAGDPVVIIGNPSGLVGSVSTGIVAALREVEKSSWIQITAPISSGSSGSPVLNEQGEAVGVATFMIAGKTRQNNNFASHYQMVRQLLEECRHDGTDGSDGEWKDVMSLVALRNLEEGDGDSETGLPDDEGGELVLDEDSEARMREAWDFVKNDELDAAEDIISSLKEGGLSDFEYLCISFAGGRFSSAISQAKACLELYPNSALLWYALGDCHFAKDESGVGIQCHLQSIKCDDSFVRPWAMVGFRMRQGPELKSAGIYASKVACGLDPKLRDIYVKNGMWLPELKSEDRAKWRDLYASYMWTEIYPNSVDYWIIHVLSVKRWEGAERARNRLKVGIENTDESPDLLEMEKTL